MLMIGKLGDVRMFQLSCTVTPPGSTATIDFISPVNTAVLQNIPIVSLQYCRVYRQNRATVIEV